MLPARLGRASRETVTPYGRFVTSAYLLPDGERAVLQVHEVIGAGSEAFQAHDCPRHVTIARRSVCVRASSGQVSLSWVLSDTLQVILGAPDEARVMALARALALAPFVQLAASLRARLDAAGTEGDEASGLVVSAIPRSPPPASATPTEWPRPRVRSIPTPTYPPEARAQRREGNVYIRAEVAADGSLTSATVMSGDPVFHAAALECARAALFDAALDTDGHAVAGIALVIVRFALD